MSAHTLHGHREPSLLGEFFAALLHNFLCWLVERRSQQAAPPAVRPDCGVDDAYPADLHVIGIQLVDDREFGLLCGDLVGETAEFTLEDRVFAETVSLSTHDAWPDAVNLAFAGGAR